MGISEILVTVDHELAQLKEVRALLAGLTAPKPKVGKLGNGGSAPLADKPASKKKNLSAEGRKRISEAVRRRWAAQKKAASAK